tara:strand:- start:4071 stop:4691 length:621 start_codon:yes stop_codon:yes gene_type:complete
MPGERQFVICASGNLATTQSVFDQIEQDIEASADVSLMTVKTLVDAAKYVGKTSVTQQRLTPGGHIFEANFLVSGQIIGAPCRAFLIYPEGNYITSSPETPFLQIGEAKYGKPILDRLVNVNSSLEQAVYCALLSMDATTRSNMSVGPPIDVSMYRKDELDKIKHVRFSEDSPYLRSLRNAWNRALRTALADLPEVDWDEHLPENP